MATAEKIENQPNQSQSAQSVDRKKGPQITPIAQINIRRRCKIIKQPNKDPWPIIARSHGTEMHRCS